jgi:uncharacterized protein YuzE
MKIHFDEQTQAIYIRLVDSKIVDSEQVRAGVILDFNAEGQVVGMEFLKVKDYIPLAQLKHVEFEIT